MNMIKNQGNPIIKTIMVQKKCKLINEKDSLYFNKNFIKAKP